MEKTEILSLWFFYFHQNTQIFCISPTLDLCNSRTLNSVFLLPADLFDILLPMLNIYQEFVRNHQYSLQVLANCKQNRDFDKLLKQYELNAACEGRMLETFLTYPMFQVIQKQLHSLFTKHMTQQQYIL